MKPGCVFLSIIVNILTFSASSFATELLTYDPFQFKISYHVIDHTSTVFASNPKNTVQWNLYLTDTLGPTNFGEILLL